MRPSRERDNDPPGSGMPDIRALPDVGFNRPASTRRSVVFPAPLGPKSARHSPGARENVTPATACLGTNSRVRSATSTIGAALVEILEDIRLELATLARAAQNRVSLRLDPTQRAHRLRSDDRHRRFTDGKPEIRPAARVQAASQCFVARDLRTSRTRPREILGRAGWRAGMDQAVEKGPKGEPSGSLPATHP